MKVALVTPMAPESAIADVMLQAVPYLAREVDLDVWCPSEPELRSCPVPLIPFEEAGDATRQALAAYDLAIWVLGNSRFHTRILPLARALPGLAVLHDVAMTDLVRLTAVEHNDLDELATRIADTAGPIDAESWRAGGVPDGGRAGWLRLSERVPLDDYVLEASLGAVVHSRWHATKVDGRTLGAVTVASLPVPASHLGFSGTDVTRVNRLLSAIPPEDLLLVTVGAVNANRQVDLLIDAIAADRALAGRLHLWAVGGTERAAASALLSRAAAAGLSDRVTLTGQVTDAALDAVLARADIAAALREPVLEGQSASVLTQMLSGTAVMVLDQAHYAELPDDAVVKVDPRAPLRGLQDALVMLAEDPERRRRIGAAARAHVVATRSGAAYARGLAEGIRRALEARPTVTTTAVLAERLRRLGLHEHDVVVDRVSDLALELFDTQ